MILNREKEKLTTKWSEFFRLGLFSLFVTGLCVGCGQEAGAEQRSEEVRSYLEGEITLSVDIDSTANFSGFEVLVANRTETSFDTLAITETDVNGKFSTVVNAPRTNIYSLIISREGSILRVGEIAIADGDSASFKVQFPFGQRPIMIRSEENAALLGFKNTVALHNAEIDALSRQGVVDQSVYVNKISQTAGILWGLQESAPGTLAASLAAAQSIIMLESWDDSLLVARTAEIDPNNVNFGNVVGAARRAKVRLDGAESGPAYVEELKNKVTDEDILATVQSELVLAYRDNNENDAALAAARELKMQHATDSSWIRWADRAIFDLENLRPGMDAPAFSLVDSEGTAVSLDSFTGRYVILEFYIPGAEFEEQLAARNAFYRADEDEPTFDILSISLQPDSVLNEAFFEGRDLPGRHVFLEEGPNEQIIKDYNVFLLPTRYLIDPEGKFVGKYVLKNTLNAFEDALVLSQANESGG